MSCGSSFRLDLRSVLKLLIGLLIRADSVSIELVKTFIDGETFVSVDDNVASNVNDLAPGNASIVPLSCSTSLVAIILGEVNAVLPNIEISSYP